jgi:hypothetical protein
MMTKKKERRRRSKSKRGRGRGKREEAASLYKILFVIIIYFYSPHASSFSREEVPPRGMIYHTGCSRFVIGDRV